MPEGTGLLLGLSNVSALAPHELQEGSARPMRRAATSAGAAFTFRSNGSRPIPRF